MLVSSTPATTLTILAAIILLQQGVALTRRSRTGPPFSVGRPTAHAPGGRPASPPAALQTTTDDGRQRAKQ